MRYVELNNEADHIVEQMKSLNFTGDVINVELLMEQMTMLVRESAKLHNKFRSMDSSYNLNYILRANMNLSRLIMEVHYNSEGDIYNDK